MNRIGFTVLAAVVGLAGCGDRNAANQTQNAVVPDSMAGNAMSGNAMSGNAMSGNAMSGAMGAGAMTSGASASLQKADGTAAGTAKAEPMDGALKISIQVEGLPAGQHGVHVHMTGRCDGPSFASAGSHWNPTNAKHGLDNPQGQHAGDMPNLVVGPDGRGTLDYTLKGGNLAGLLDTDGSAIVVHAKVDDQKTDPSGDSGDRIACGVFRTG